VPGEAFIGAGAEPKGTRLETASSSPKKPIRKSDAWWLFAILTSPIALGIFELVAVPLIDKPSCPAQQIACWSTGNSASWVGLLLNFVPIVLFLPIFLYRKEVDTFIKILFPIIIAESVLFVSYRANIDSNDFAGISSEGLFTKNTDVTVLSRYPWSGVRSVLAWCETGSKSGPKVNLYFKVSDNRQIGVSLGTWERVTHDHPDIVTATNGLPYTTKGFEFCSHYISDLPHRLN